MAWDCRKDEFFKPGNALGLVDVDISTSSASYTACTESCNGAGARCVAVRYHGEDNHCHGLMGAPPSVADFTKALNSTAQAQGYWSCLLVKKP